MSLYSIHKAVSFSVITLLVAITTIHEVSAELIPFTMPWDDQSQNITNFSNTLHQPAGLYGRVNISDDGHFELNEQRIRFFGANIVADACFPTKDIADDIAGRYARLGFNVARFHHLDNTWTTSLIDYSSGTSKVFDAEVLDRLDYFLSKLKSNGVYINLNLLNARVFQANDGLGPEITELGNKQQAIIGMFHGGARSLQKEYALTLLQHINPYTGLSYAEDPAIAFVEINNENGMLQQWHEGTFNNLPTTFATALEEKWNLWLQEKYESTEALLTAWQPIDQALGAEMIINGDFSSTSGWGMEEHSTAQANLTSTHEFNGSSAGKVEVETTSSTSWHVQLNQSGLALEAGQIYTISYWTKGNYPNPISASIRQAHDPWQGLGYDQSIQLSNEWVKYESTFFPTESDDNVRFNVSGLGSYEGTLHIANVSLRPGGSMGTLPIEESLESGNISTPTTTHGYTTEGMKDWFSFMRDIETEYWQDMRWYIEQIGYQGIQWGTTVMNSPPSAQATFGVTDSHAYWKHPIFPNTAWSATDWYVENDPMVNDEQGGVIPQLSWQRIKGMPHNVTEYQHSAPNQYSASAALFAAVYGSIQDWDGIYLFAYGGDWDRGFFNGFFDVDQHPAKLSNAIVAGMAFRNFTIPTTTETFVAPFGKATELEVLMTKGQQWQVGDARNLEFGNYLPLMQRVSMDMDLELASTDIVIPDAPEEPIYTTTNGAVTWDLSQPGQGVLTAKSSKLKTLIGFDAERTFDLDGIVFNPAPNELGWETLSAYVTEGIGFDDLKSGCKGIIVSTGYSENTNMQWTDETKTSVANNWGEAPVMVESIPGTITFEVPTNALNVWSLDVRGNRVSPIEIHPTGSNSYFHIGDATPSLWYEFEVLSH